MSKISKLNKTLLITLSTIFIAFTILLIVLCAIPRTNNYTVKTNSSLTGKEIVTTIKFEDKKIVTYENNIKIGDSEYKIDKGELYSGIVKIGKINAFKIKSLDGKLVFKSNVAIALLVISIVIMSLSGVGLAVIIILHFVKAKKRK